LYPEDIVCQVCIELRKHLEEVVVVGEVGEIGEVG
jgi:hypothetical protein